MGRINAVVCSDAPADVLYDMGHRAYEFPELFPRLKELRILDSSEDMSYVKASLTVQPGIRMLPGLSWIQEDYWDAETLTCRFSLSEDNTGMIKKLDGEWIFKPVGTGAEMAVDIDFVFASSRTPKRAQQKVDDLLEKSYVTLMNKISCKAQGLPIAV